MIVTSRVNMANLRRKLILCGPYNSLNSSRQKSQLTTIIPKSEEFQSKPRWLSTQTERIPYLALLLLGDEGGLIVATVEMMMWRINLHQQDIAHLELVLLTHAHCSIGGNQFTPQSKVKQQLVQLDHQVNQSYAFKITHHKQNHLNLLLTLKQQLAQLDNLIEQSDTFKIKP